MPSRKADQFTLASGDAMFLSVTMLCLYNRNTVFNLHLHGRFCRPGHMYVYVELQYTLIICIMTVVT